MSQFIPIEEMSLDGYQIVNAGRRGIDIFPGGMYNICAKFRFPEK